MTKRDQVEAERLEIEREERLLSLVKRQADALELIAVALEALAPAKAVPYTETKEGRAALGKS